jgi:hypothetical protein
MAGMTTARAASSAPLMTDPRPLETPNVRPRDRKLLGAWYARP